MLPSTGYFKTINCPFYETGSCDRPFCHFKHSRKDDTASVLVSTTAETPQVVAKTEQVESSTTPVAASNPDVLQKLVTEAVKKVLADQEVTDTANLSENIVTKVVEELKPTLKSSSLAPFATTLDPLVPSTIGKHTGVPSSVTKCVYNPTPIAELKKRHIPIAAYMPTRDSKVSVKRKASPERSKNWLPLAQNDKSCSTSTKIHSPVPDNSLDSNNSITHYVPTTVSELSPTNSFDDSNSNEFISKKTKDQYLPKVKKRREEYVPRRVKNPLKTVQQLEEVIDDETVLDEFEKKFQTVDKNADMHDSRELQEFEDMEAKFSDEDAVDENVDALKEEMRQLKEEVSNLKSLEEKENTLEKEEEEEEEEEEDGDDPKLVNRKSNSSSHKKDSSSSSSRNKYDGTKKEKSSRSDKSNAATEDREKRKDEKRSRASKSRSSSSSKDKHSSSKSRENLSSSKDKSKEKDKSDKCREKYKEKDRDRRKDRDREKKREKERSKNSEGKDKDLKVNKSKCEKSKSKKDSRNDRDKEKDKHKSDKYDRHRSKSSSNSKSDKHKSQKSEEKHLSNSESDKNNRSSKKSLKLKESSREQSDYDDIARNSSNESGDLHFNFEDEESPFELSESDHDVEEECLKIFQEYEVSDHSKDTLKQNAYKPPIEEVAETEDVSHRKRVAHPSASSSSAKLIEPSQPRKTVNPHFKLYERWRRLKAAASERAPAQVDEYVPKEVKSSPGNRQGTEYPTELNSIKNDAQVNGNGRIRIAHVPYAMSLALAKKKVIETTLKPVETKTVAQTSKSGPRVAHVPQTIPQLTRPEPMQVTTQKFPVNVRQYYVNLMHDICVQIYTNGDDAATRATREEFACHERCKAVAVYKNSCMLAVHRLRKELDQGTEGGSSVFTPSGMVSHEAVLAGKTKGSWSVLKTRKSITNLHGVNLYYLLSKWILTEQQLKDHGFPRPHPDGPKGRAKVYVTNTRNQSILSKVPNERICCRCNQAYMVDKYGMQIRQQNCIYHWGRKFTVRGEGRYSCCQQDGSAGGCCDARSHVWDHVHYDNLRGYVKTLSKDVPSEEQGVYALDCEMCYTTQGLELVRVTVINEDCNVVYETLVKPDNPIIDYNTRFSGITEENMIGVSTTLLDVQATFLTMFSSKTILVGHSLESDFKALKLIHDTVVDTSVMFPHRHGYPQKRALKNLCSEYLRKIIQNDVNGHDSNEDAIACMELILWKVKEEAKLLQ